MINKKKIADYPKDNYSSDTERYLGDIFAEEANIEELRAILKQQWDELSPDESEKLLLDHIMYKLNYHINTSGQTQKKSPVYRLLQWYARIAALLLIPLMVYAGVSVYKNSNRSAAVEGWAEMNAPMGARIRFTLPDGSFGWLNSGSKLKYALNFNKVRVVQLSGEAFFDVKHLEGENFVVKTTHLEVEVIGTSFDVAAYDDEEEVDVTLEQGSVFLKSAKMTQPIELKPNEQVSYNIAKESFTKSKVLAPNYSAWKEGKLILRNASLEELAKQLSRWYNVETRIENNQNIEYQYRATFEDENLAEVLRLLKISSRLDYILDERSKQADGTFRKQKLLLRVK
jgi:ferric-dicitrate binding protein FerR (iron transport regulator)